MGNVALENFTPIFDSVAKDLGPTAAMLHGKVWRYCEMSRSVCDAAMGRIAEECGISYSTALRHVKALCEKGYLLDATPDLRNKPHTYIVTEKVKLVIGARDTEQTQTPCQNDIPPCQNDRPALSKCNSGSIKMTDEDTSNKQVRNKEERARGASAEVRDLEAYFSYRSNIPVLKPTRPSEYGEHRKLWRDPLERILEYAGGDVKSAKALIDTALKKLAGLTVSDPNSTIKTVRAIVAEQGRVRASVKKRDGAVYVAGGSG